MAGSQRRIHKKMDKIFQKLDALEDNDKALTKQTKYMKQLVILAKQDSALQRKKSRAMLRDMGQMLLKVKESSDRTEERVAAILAGTRQH